MGMNEKEKINNPFIGTIFERGYGYAFSYIMNHPDYDLDMKYVAAVYGLFFNADGSGSCTAAQDTIIKKLARMKKTDFLTARKKLEAEEVLIIALRRASYKENSGRKANDTTEVSLNLVPKGFVDNKAAGVRYNNILSYHYGQLPRVIFLDDALEKTDKVIASYIFANAGKLREYYLSGVKLRKILRNLDKNGNLEDMSMYRFEKSIARLKPYLEFRRLTDAEVLAWRKDKYQEEAETNEHGDFYIVTVKGMPGSNGSEYKPDRAYSAKMNNYAAKSQPYATPENLGTEEDSLIVDNSNLGTEEQGTEEEGTDDLGTEEQGTAINSLLSEKGLSLKNTYSPEKSLYPHNPVASEARDRSDDEKTFHDSNVNVSKKCPLELRKRLGEKEARHEVETLYSVLHQFDEDKYMDRLCRINSIIDSLYEIAQSSPELEEYALAMNAAYLISHRAMELDIRNIGGYVRRILENAQNDNGFVITPVYEISGYRAYLDGYKLSNGGYAERDLLIKSQNEEAEEKDISFYIDDLADYIRSFGYCKGEEVFCPDTPLPTSLTEDKTGRRALARILFSFFRKSSYNMLKDTYYGTYANGETWLDDAILTFQEAIIELWNPHEEFYFADDVYFDRHYYSKFLMSLFYISQGKLCIKSNISEKVVALFLNAQSQSPSLIVNRIRWIKTTIANELRFAYRLKDGDNETIDLLEPVPAFKEDSRQKNKKIFSYMRDDYTEPRKNSAGSGMEQERGEEFDFLGFIMEKGPKEARDVIENIKAGRAFKM